MDIFSIISMLGGIALFLYGMRFMGEQLEKLSGGKLEYILEKMTDKTYKGILLGAVVTAVVQSSSAVTVMVVGFVNSGIMQLSRAIGVIMGANIGTTVTAWILSLTQISGDSIFITLLKPSSFSPVIAIVSVFMLLLSKNEKRKNIGGILMGFSVLMMGMTIMSDSMSGLAENENFTSLMLTFSNPVIGIIAGTLLAAVVQSSSAAVGIVQALAISGSISFSAALPLILGQNIGSCVPVLISSVGTSKNAKRTSLIYLYFNIIGVIVTGVLFYGAESIFGFDFMDNTSKLAPLAERMRPTSLDDFVGQTHIVGKGKLLRRAIAADSLGSIIFYGPPGCGKTTLANIIANTTKADFVRLNAVSSGVAEAKKVIEDAKERLKMYGKKTYLMLDECHRWNKAQSDSVLAGIEQGYIVFIGSTTENPFISMTRAIVSRCRIFEFKKLNSQDIKQALNKALSDKENGLGNYEIKITDEALNHIVWASDGDLRTAYNALELAVVTTQPDSQGKIIINKNIAEESIQKKALSIDESMYYDMLSAFCKSLRGSDSDAAVYWAIRLIESGCDPMLIARRLIAHSAEDVGMADPMAQLMATSAMFAIQNIGMPEGRLPLVNSIIYVCEASKSNSVVNALDKAVELVNKSKDDIVPLYLRDANFKVEKVEGYKYPHSFGGWVEQQYLPDSLRDEKLYIPSTNGKESTLVRAKVIKKNKG